MKRTAQIVTLVLTAVAAAAHAGLGFPDHVQCFRVKDSVGKATYTATLTPAMPPFAVQSGCVIKVPAKLLCTGVGKTEVTPPPVPSGSGLPITNQYFACYKLKCPKVDLTVDVNDQFGSHSMTVKAPTLLCAPASPGGETCESSPAPQCGGVCVPEGFCMDLGGGQGCACFR